MGFGWVRGWGLGGARVLGLLVLWIGVGVGVVSGVGLGVVGLDCLLAFAGVPPSTNLPGRHCS